jgi:type IV pilus assembly protein PilY1
MRKNCLQIFILPILILVLSASNAWAVTSIAQYPLFLTNGVPPIVMLTMGRDHKLYYEAYNDASDLNDDGQLDIGYDPAIDYFGYFDSYKCYNYSSNLFVPASETANKQCSGNWSGDFLNYVTTSRMDALRKVLYGGFRSTDSTSQTVLERAFIPQDAHSWGKEYTSTAVNGYNISSYTPLSQPSIGTRHLFANVSLSYPGQPLMRVLNDSTYRIWEWVSIERPVAGSRCLNGGSGPTCTRAGGTSGVTVPSDVLSNVERKTYDISGTGSNHPNNSSEFDTWETNYATVGRLDGSGSMTTIEGTDNPYGADDNYMTIVTATITIPTTGTYEFTVDGDDAVDVTLSGVNGTYTAGYYGGHGTCNCDTHTTGPITLSAGTHTIKFRHEERGGGDSFVLRWVKTLPASTMTDYSVNVKACVTGLLESNCKAYSDGSTTTYKPTGILQRYGENDLMAFGLLTGSYQNNTAGGVVRKNIASFADEVDLDTGIFTSMSGIVDTIDKLRIESFNYSNKQYSSGWITTRPINQGEAQEWGNPVAEMMYEGLRYFAGKASPTSAYNSGVSTGTDTTALSLPLPTWQDPYRTTAGGYAHCAKPLQLVISDINSSYDSDQLPGSYFNGSFVGDLTGMNVSTLADTIWAGESEASNVFIGQSGTNSDGTPSPKTVTTFANIRGLAPEEPSKLGSYYAGSVALYGKKTDLHTIEGKQNVDTLSVALASPLPRIEIPVSGKIVTLVPFAKSVGGSSISSVEGNFQPTNQIVDFYIETIVNTNPGNTDSTINSGRPYGLFRINYEDVEQAADHDMDAIVEYIFTVNASNQLEVELNSTYAAGGIIQHMGYVISGTTQDGTYLDVRDEDTNEGSDPDYFLDTPPGQLPGGVWNDGTFLPLASSRTFTVGTTASASFIKHNPLWYAAKWSMTDTDNNGTLEASEWDTDSDGAPDGYFLVTNAGKLETQLNKAFAEIIARTSSSAAVATNSTRLDTNTKIYQARFNSNNWSGQLLAFDLNDTNGTIGSQVWDAATLIPPENSRNIFSYNPSASIGSRGITFEYANLNSTQKAYLDMDALGTTDSLGTARVNYIRGDQSNEITNGPFRSRTSLLGDIVNSDPWFVGQSDNLGYSVLAGTEGTSYPAYLTSKANKTAMLYFGANDGMLHGIDANTGIEKFAYMPESLIPKLNILTSPLYGCSGSSCLPHQYFVDGAPKSGDAYINLGLGSGAAWHSILLGTLGGGGKGFFALNITTPTDAATTGAPSTFSSSDVMWEVSNAQSPKAADLASFQANLGYTLPQASVVRMHNGKWAAIVANGYESTQQNAVLFIIDIESGEIIEMIDTGIGGSGSPNGLSTPISVDEDGDSIVDAIYAGDLLGNLWKFDVSANNSNSWGSAFRTGSTPKPLYTAKDDSGVVQPITAKPQVGKHPDGGLMVYFGTGKYFEVNDQIVSATPQKNSFYAIRDQDVIVSSRTNLQEQSILYETTVDALAIDLRVTSDTTVDYATKKGWYIDLESPVNGAEGERVVSSPLLRGGRVIFTTLIPESDPCGWGGSSWLMELDAVNGQRLTTSPFDINEDGVFDSDDLINSFDTNGDGTIDADDQVEVSGMRKHDIGIIKTPGVVTTGNGTEMKYVSGSSGNLDNISESSGDPIGRQSWRQLR